MALSLPSASADVPRKSRPIPAGGIVVIAWFEAVVTILVATKPKLSGLSLFADNALRLVQIRDLLAGQSWFDLTQYRLHPPGGVAMHWTRVVDGGVASLIVFFRLFTGPAMAETLAICVWPLLLLLPAFFAIARIATRLADRETGIVALILTMTCFTMLGYFAPGEIDHDNLQLVFMLWAIAFLIDLGSAPRAAFGLALVCALSLAVGLETMPFELIAVLAVSFFWIARGNGIAVPVRRFGLTFAAAVLLLTFAVIAPHERYGAACDTLSGLFSTLAVVGGTGLAALTMLPALSTPIRRGAAIGALTIVLLGIMAAINPECMRGPYATLSPLLQRIWLSGINEVRSPFFIMRHNVPFFITTYVYECVTVVATFAAIFLVERGKRWSAVALFAFTAAALAVTSAEIRGVRFGILFGVPGLAVAIRLALKRFVRPGMARAAATIAAILLFSNFAFSYVGETTLATAEQNATRAARDAANKKCLDQTATTPLTKLPPGEVAPFLDIAPSILLYTKDSALAGMYHRDTRGILDDYYLFTGPLPQAAAILKRNNIDYVMTCEADGSYGAYVKEGKGKGLMVPLSKDHPPAWLEPVPADPEAPGVRIYKVLRDKLP